MNRCALCPGKYRCVEASGPENDELLFVGEAPGGDEDKKGIPFTGKTGQEIDETHLPAAGLKRPNLRFDNAISCWPDTPQHKIKTDNDKHIALLKCCAEHHLYPYLRRVQPRVIVAMGAFACYAMDPDIQLDLHHGIPLQTQWGIVFPMWHPAGGLHEPKKMLQIRTDFIRLGDYLRGNLLIPEDQYPNPDYQECNGYMLDEIDPTIPMAADTEYSKSLGAYCLTYSQVPGTGRLIQASRKDQLQKFQSKISRWESYIDFHNGLYDKTVTEEMGLDFPWKILRDTMVTAFNLGNLPQGLKALCYRELGMEMQDFDDLVIPYSRPHVIDYYKLAYAMKWDKPLPQEVIGKDGSHKTYQAHSMSTKLKVFFTYLAKNPEGKDVFKMFEDNWVDQQEEIESKCGPYPGRDIAHVPFDKVIHYACRDSDGTLRIRPILERMKEAAMRGLPQERWREYVQ